MNVLSCQTGIFFSARLSDALCFVLWLLVVPVPEVILHGNLVSFVVLIHHGTQTTLGTWSSFHEGFYRIESLQNLGTISTFGSTFWAKQSDEYKLMRPGSLEFEYAR